MKIALVYDRVNKWGGAERVLLALHRLYPDAPLFTAVYDRKRAAWADVFTVHPSFLSRLPLANRMHESLPLVTPMAFETFTFDGYDAVITVTSAEAKGILTKPETVHICYCLTPTRYLWSGYRQYRKHPGLGAVSSIASVALTVFAPLLRRWDRIAASRPDYYIAISERVKERIREYYGRETEAVVCPPVDTDMFAPNRGIRPSDVPEGYFLCVSRLVSYKRVDVLIRAFNRLRLPRVVIGNGHLKRELMRLSGDSVTVIDRHLTDEELVGYYSRCRAFVFAADEDFGLSAAEAQACGKPVIAYRQSGISEFVVDGKTGILFDRQTPESVIAAVKRFTKKQFSVSVCRAQAERMSEQMFSATMKRIVSELVKNNTV